MYAIGEDVFFHLDQTKMEKLIDRIVERNVWCSKNCIGNYNQIWEEVCIHHYVCVVFQFEKKQDAMHFKLVWASI